MSSATRPGLGIITLIGLTILLGAYFTFAAVQGDYGLFRRVQDGGVREVILATSPTLEGDGTALFASNLLAGTGVAVTKLARGLPSGTSLELANPQILADALDGRRAV